MELDEEQSTNYVLYPFFETRGRPQREAQLPAIEPKGFAMFRAVVEEAAALASLTLFLGMIAIWAQVLGTL